MTESEFNIEVMAAFTRTFPSTMEWLAKFSESDRAAVLGQWFLELTDETVIDVVAVIEAIHVGREEGPEAWDRESWPAFILRVLRRQRAEAAEKYRSGASDGVWQHLTSTDAQLAYAFRECVEARRTAMARYATAEPHEREAQVQLAGYKAVADVLDPARKNRVPGWGDY